MKNIYPVQNIFEIVTITYMYDIIGLMSRKIASADWATLYNTKAIVPEISDSNCLPPQVLRQGICLRPCKSGRVVSARPNADIPTRL